MKTKNETNLHVNIHDLIFSLFFIFELFSINSCRLFPNLTIEGIFHYFSQKLIDIEPRKKRKYFFLPKHRHKRNDIKTTGMINCFSLPKIQFI